MFALALLVSSVCLAGSVQAQHRCKLSDVLTEPVKPWNSGGRVFNPFDAAATSCDSGDYNSRFGGVFRRTANLGSRNGTGPVTARLASRSCDEGGCDSGCCGSDARFGSGIRRESRLRGDGGRGLRGGGLGSGCRPGAGFGLGSRGHRRENRGGRGLYLSGALGVNIWEGMAQAILQNGNTFGPESGIDDSEVYRVAVGRRHGFNWRTEFEGVYRRQEFDANVAMGNQNNAFNGDRNSTAVMFNLVREFNRGNRITPFVKAGVGASYNRAKGSLINTTPFAMNTTIFPEKSSTEFAWTAGGGFSTAVTGYVSMDIEYQYFDMGDSTTGSEIGGSRIGFGGTGHEVSVGMRLDF